MAPRLRVLAGTSPTTMVPITDLVNTSKSHKISTDVFEGEIVANIKGLTNDHGELRESEYFGREERAGVTWSIQVQGRFLVPHSADDILFGNTFDRPLKLPWGTSAVLKFMHYIDPTLEHDLMSTTKPWALSPLISTMPYFAHKRMPASGDPAASHFPPTESVKDSTGQLYLAAVEDDASSATSSSSRSSSSSLGVRPGSGAPSPASSASSLNSATSATSNKSGGSERIKQAMKKVTKRRKSRSESEMQHLDGPSQRRTYFANEKKRKGVVFGPEDQITTDFCYGFINFAPALSLQLPGGLSFDLMKYWDGQPVRFVCCERRKDGAGGDGDPWGRIFWCVAIEIADDE